MSTFNPVRQALDDNAFVRGVNRKNGAWMTRLCWKCGKDKPRQGGEVKGPVGVAHARSRFTCADCVAIRATSSQPTKENAK